MSSNERKRSAECGVTGKGQVATGIPTGRRTNLGPSEEFTQGRNGNGQKHAARVYVAAENRLLREALSRMLMRHGHIEAVGMNCDTPSRAEALIEEKADILLMTSRGNMPGDLSLIRRIRLTTPSVRILMIGVAEDNTEFLQYVRAGVQGYLPRDASAEDVLEAIGELQEGAAVCPGTLCALLFRFFEREATSLPSAAVHQRLGLTRREQQLIPLIAQGLTNKEIANHFCLSEQTVKNHLYRMKHKVGQEVCSSAGPKGFWFSLPLSSAKAGLFVAQGHHRIDARCTLRRKIGCQDRNANQDG